MNIKNMAAAAAPTINLFCGHGCGATIVNGNFVAGPMANVTAGSCPNNNGNAHFMVPETATVVPRNKGKTLLGLVKFFSQEILGLQRLLSQEYDLDSCSCTKEQNISSNMDNENRNETAPFLQHGPSAYQRKIKNKK